MDRANVFTENPNEKKLNRSDEKQADHQRRRPHLKGLPEQQLINQIYKRHQKTERANAESGKRRQP